MKTFHNAVLLLLIPVFMLSHQLTAKAGPGSGDSAAPTEAHRREALELLKSGTRKLKEKNYQMALWDLEKGYKLYQHFAFPLFMGRCHYHLDRPTRALEMFKEAENLGKLTPRHKKLLAEYRKDAKKRMEFDKVMVITVPTNGVEVWINGEKVGTTPLTDPISLPKGAHKIETIMDGYRTTERSVDVSGGGVVSVRIEMQKDDSYKPAVGDDPDESGDHPLQRTDTVDSHDPKTTTTEQYDSQATDIDVRKEKKPGLLSPYEWTAVGLAAAGVAGLIAGGVYLGIDGKDTRSDPPAEFTARRYTTKNLGIGFAVTGGALIVGAGVVYGVGRLLRKMQEDEHGRLNLNSVMIAFDPVTGTPIAGAGFEF